MSDEFDFGPGPDASPSECAQFWAKLSRQMGFAGVADAAVQPTIDHPAQAEQTPLDDFFDLRDTLIDPESGEQHTGSYRDLRVWYPALRQIISEKHKEWKRAGQSEVSFNPSSSRENSLAAALQSSESEMIGPADLEHESVEAAKEYLSCIREQDCKKLDVEDDDWELVKSTQFKDLCAKLFNALRKPGKLDLSEFNEKEQQYAKRNHEAKLNNVLEALKTPKQITLAKAQVMCAIGEAIKVHEIGIPYAVYEKMDKRNHRGYQSDEHMKCSERIRKIIKHTKNSKYVAWDVITGEHLSLALGPDSHLGRKKANMKTNANRTPKPRSSRRIQEDDVTAGDTSESPRKRRKLRSNTETPIKGRAGSTSETQRDTDDLSTPAPESSSYGTPLPSSLLGTVRPLFSEHQTQAAAAETPLNPNSQSEYGNLVTEEDFGEQYTPSPIPYPSSFNQHNYTTTSRADLTVDPRLLNRKRVLDEDNDELHTNKRVKRFWYDADESANSSS